MDLFIMTPMFYVKHRGVRISGARFPLVNGSYERSVLDYDGYTIITGRNSSWQNDVVVSGAV